MLVLSRPWKGHGQSLPSGCFKAPFPWASETGRWEDFANLLQMASSSLVKMITANIKIYILPCLGLSSPIFHVVLFTCWHSTSKALPLCSFVESDESSNVTRDSGGFSRLRIGCVHRAWCLECSSSLLIRYILILGLGWGLLHQIQGVPRGRPAG